MTGEDAERHALFTLPHIAAAFITYWLVATAYNFITAPTPPTSIPWMGYGKGWFAGFRNFTALTKSKEWLLAGYEKYSRHDSIFVLPATLGMTAEIIVPRSQMSWMLDQPDHVLSTSEAHYDLLQGDYSFVNPIILKDPYHEHVIHKNLVRNLNAIIPEIEAEVPRAIADVYGTDTEHWETLDIMDSFMKMIPVLTNRMLLGETVCRERKFLDAVLSFTMDCVRTQTMMVIIPKALQPIFGRLFGLASKYHYWLSSRFTLPMIRQRISEIEKKDAGDANYKDWKEPRDFITWSYRTAKAEGRLDEMQPDRIAQRILPINFASIHTTSLTAYETMVNVLSAGPEVVEKLREEAHRILQEEGGWTKQGLSRMHRMDSAIRESQRLSPIALTFSHRKVVSPEGIITPERVHLKRGAILSAPWTPLAADAEFHDRPGEFDAFRYSRPREEYEAMSAEDKGNVDALKLKQTGLVTTGLHHLPFGHGRHACPGRFFVSHELKMIFSHLLLNYDFKPLLEKPKKLWIVRYQVPLPAKIEVRHRKSAWMPASS
ncbi:cytochrome p450 [Stemphylium lycopersici]|uniref:Cytochrome p450 n=1 Tax=Stemphylium lycopersici TaxID=183478 RepID=A0A364N0D1_STELY|nr:cytochrome p450 [Stemphylium lycopersici]RAR00775.1 cytochrome p450 [Stemphylium lycopersici]RAR08218.1 cytochrome p450 [Stemphylium lycopersici]